MPLGAKGAYTIVDDGGRDTYLAYILEVPEEPGDVQKELRITPQARFHLSIKVVPIAAMLVFYFDRPINMSILQGFLVTRRNDY